MLGFETLVFRSKPACSCSRSGTLATHWSTFASPRSSKEVQMHRQQQRAGLHVRKHYIVRLYVHEESLPLAMYPNLFQDGLLASTCSDSNCHADCRRQEGKVL